jgi:hypothetical protein
MDKLVRPWTVEWNELPVNQILSLSTDTWSLTYRSRGKIQAMTWNFYYELKEKQEGIELQMKFVDKWEFRICLYG